MLERFYIYGRQGVVGVTAGLSSQVAGMKRFIFGENGVEALEKS